MRQLVLVFPQIEINTNFTKQETKERNLASILRREEEFSSVDGIAMEVSGTVLQRVTCSTGAGTGSRFAPRRFASGGSVAVGRGARFHGAGRGVRVSARPTMGSAFCDDGHLRYYQASTSPRCGGREKQKGSAVLTTKKKLKLLKGLSESLKMVSELGFPLDLEQRALLDEVQGKLTSDSAEVLLEQLEQIRAEKKEMKKQKKQEKAQLKASRMKTVPDCESSSSSSSSESSDSDCEEIVDMSSLRTSAALVPATVDQLQSPPLSAVSQVTTAIEENFRDVSTANLHAAEISGNGTSLSSNCVSFKDESSIASNITAPHKRIEVCMGNKCKRSGAPALLQEFERVMGAEGTVVGCKCMGKCKLGPNVRVKNSVVDDLTEGLSNDSVMTPANPLYIGVSLEDVDAIVASFLGDNQRDPNMGADAAI